MIQFNLLPDIKQEFVRVNRTKRLVIVICVLVSAVVLVVFLLLLTWDGLQKKNLSNINSDITTNKNQLTSTTNLNQILTIQNQLSSLPALDKQNPVVSRIFGYISQLTPTTATISTLNVNFTEHSVTISGAADSLATINVFADTLKFTTYSLTSTSAQKTAFSSVVLSSFQVSSNGTTYSLSFNYDPALFSNSNSVSKLTVPPEVTTRSELDQPTDIFKK